MLSYVPQQRTTVVLYEHPEFRSVTRAHAWTSGLFDGRSGSWSAGPSAGP